MSMHQSGPGRQVRRVESGSTAAPEERMLLGMKLPSSSTGILSLVFLWTGCAATDAPSSGATPSGVVDVVLASDVEWEYLNPARGDQSPRAGTLWGDRNGGQATGFLLRPVDGFRSPPHLHNVSYRGVVLRGVLHNDDPGAADTWMPAGSYWTQPKGEVHITAALGQDTLAYIEIEEGPYRVLPVPEAFDSGEVALNVDASNLVWVSLPGDPGGAAAPRVAYLWGEPGPDTWSGVLLHLPAGAAGSLVHSGEALGAVVVEGTVELTEPGAAESRPLPLGSYFRSRNVSPLGLVGDPAGGSVLYLRVHGTFDWSHGG